MKPSFLSLLRSFILPITVLVIIPGAILWPGGFKPGWGLVLPWEAVVIAAGVIVTGAGAYFLVLCIRLFRDIGRGTLAPWSPTNRLVAVGPYLYVRNPMIVSVMVVLLGEAIVFGSVGILIELILFFGINHAYFILSEEPGLEKRFGEEYRVYKKNVPRWIPRLKPWDGTGTRC